MEAPLDAATKAELVELVRSRGLAYLGTLHDGWPAVSLVPYAPSADLAELYIHVSHLAQHTSALLADPRVGLLISKPDSPNRNPQTLARVSIQGRAKPLDPEDPEYTLARAAYVAAHPPSEFNFSLGGFVLVAIRPTSARFVAGFGRIVDLDGSDWNGLTRSE